MKRKLLSATLCGAGLLVAVMTGLAGEPASAPQGAYTLDQCLEIGLRRSSAMLKAGEDVRIAEARIRQVRAQALPHLSARGGYTRLGDIPVFDFLEDRVEMGRLDNYLAVARVSQLLYSGGSVRAGLKAAQVYRDMARFRLEQVSNEVVRDIRTGFHDILLAQAALTVQEASIAQLKDLVKQAEDRVKRGTAPEFDLLSARVRLANELPALIRARKDVELAKAAFRNLIRLDDSDFELSGALDYGAEKKPVEAWLAEGREGRPELLYQRKDVELSKLAIRAERGTLKPQVEAHAAYEGLNPGTSMAEESWEWGWNAGVSLDWDLLDGGLRRGVILQKTLELAKVQEDLTSLEEAVDLEIRQSFLELATADETVAASRETVALAEKNLDIARTRYESGLSTYLELAAAQLAVSTARLTRLTALRDHMNALARLQCACGFGLEQTDGDSP